MINYSPEVCDELLQVIKYIKPEDRDKIPKNILNYLYQNCNSESSFIYNQAKPLSEQNLSSATKEALRDFLERYWHDE